MVVVLMGVVVALVLLVLCGVGGECCWSRKVNAQ